MLTAPDIEYVMLSEMNWYQIGNNYVMINLF